MNEYKVKSDYTLLEFELFLKSNNSSNNSISSYQNQINLYTPKLKNYHLIDLNILFLVD